MKRFVMGAICLLVLSGVVAQPVAAQPVAAHTPSIVPEPGPKPYLDSLYVFCGPGKPLILSVYTVVKSAYAVWTYNYNPTLPPERQYFMSPPDIITAQTFPDESRITPGKTYPQPPGQDDEILSIYVYGQPVGNYGLINFPPHTHCE